jgi:hypothetical protein
MLQQMLVPLNSFVSLWLIMTVLLMKLALNSHRKFKFFQPLTPLNFLIWCEWYHFAQTDSCVTCVVVLPTVTDTTLREFLQFSLPTICMYLHREWSYSLFLLAVFILNYLILFSVEDWNYTVLNLLEVWNFCQVSLYEMENKNIAFTRIIFHLIMITGKSHKDWCCERLEIWKFLT